MVGGDDEVPDFGEMGGELFCKSVSSGGRRLVGDQSCNASWLRGGFTTKGVGWNGDSTSA